MGEFDKYSRIVGKDIHKNGHFRGYLHNIKHGTRR